MYGLRHCYVFLRIETIYRNNLLGILSPMSLRNLEYVHHRCHAICFMVGLNLPNTTGMLWPTVSIYRVCLNATLGLISILLGHVRSSLLRLFTSIKFKLWVLLFSFLLVHSRCNLDRRLCLLSITILRCDDTDTWIDRRKIVYRKLKHFFKHRMHLDTVSDAIPLFPHFFASSDWHTLVKCLPLFRRKSRVLRFDMKIDPSLLLNHVLFPYSISLQLLHI